MSYREASHFFLWHEIGRVGEGVRVFNGCCGAYNTTFPQNLGGIWKFPTPVDSDMLLNLSQLCQSGELLNIRGGHFKHCSFSSREQWQKSVSDSKIVRKLVRLDLGDCNRMDSDEVAQAIARHRTTLRCYCLNQVNLLFLTSVEREVESLIAPGKTLKQRNVALRSESTPWLTGGVAKKRCYDTFPALRRMVW